MSFPDVKALKRLADACRKAGIKTFKGEGIEFTLSDTLPESNYRKSKRKGQPLQDSILGDTIPEESLLFWSTDTTDHSQES